VGQSFGFASGLPPGPELAFLSINHREFLANRVDGKADAGAGTLALQVEKKGKRHCGEACEGEDTMLSRIMASVADGRPIMALQVFGKDVFIRNGLDILSSPLSFLRKTPDVVIDLLWNLQAHGFRVCPWIKPSVYVRLGRLLIFGGLLQMVDHEDIDGRFGRFHFSPSCCTMAVNKSGGAAGQRQRVLIDVVHDALQGVLLAHRDLEDYSKTFTFL